TMVDDQQLDDVATKFTMMHQYTYTDETTGEVREYDRSLRIPVRREWQLANVERFWDAEHSHYLQPYVTKKNALAFLLDRELSLKHYV
ncbi:hypothetical protein PJN93_30900, partial [Mycobacterium kansasii]